MKRYRNDAGNSGVSAYETGADWIKVRFKSGHDYLYSYRSAGEYHVEQMKGLAQKGRGLASYINKHTKDLYE